MNGMTAPPEEECNIMFGHAVPNGHKNPPLFSEHEQPARKTLCNQSTPEMLRQLKVAFCLQEIYFGEYLKLLDTMKFFARMYT